MAKVDHEIYVGTTYRFSAREVMDLLREHAGFTERQAADVVTDFVRPRELEAARRDVDDAIEAVEFYQDRVRDLEKMQPKSKP